MKQVIKTYIKYSQVCFMASPSLKDFAFPFFTVLHLLGNVDLMHAKNSLKSVVYI